MNSLNSNPRSSSDLKVVFWNCRGISKCGVELQKYLENVDVFIGVEAMLNSNKEFDIPGFHSLRIDRNNRPGGGLIFLAIKSLNFCPVQELCNIVNNLETGAIKMHGVSPSLVLGGCYRVPGTYISQMEWDQLLLTISSHGPCLIIGDFNSHSTHWNCSITDSNGTRLLNSINGCDLILINRNILAHIDTHRKKFSNLDLALCSPEIFEIVKVSIFDDTWGPDHFFLSLNLRVEKVHYFKHCRRLSSKKTDWTQFQSLLEESYNCLLDPRYELRSTIDKYNFFTKLITDAIVKSTPTPILVSPK
ncbi:uncharacterized protein LOC143179663 [Calliopsis andreniformis]|uniref:uncharacterized protein LOC143179663 n=1 Tax=Calliopsis andreniformis TaxID=337506 RepID=UPI003FCE3D11